jgi:hypothetical protein
VANRRFRVGDDCGGENKTGGGAGNTSTSRMAGDGGEGGRSRGDAVAGGRGGGTRSCRGGGRGGGTHSCRGGDGGGGGGSRVCVCVSAWRARDVSAAVAAGRAKGAASARRGAVAFAFAAAAAVGKVTRGRGGVMRRVKTTVRGRDCDGADLGTALPRRRSASSRFAAMRARCSSVNPPGGRGGAFSFLATSSPPAALAFVRGGSWNARW